MKNYFSLVNRRIEYSDKPFVRARSEKKFPQSLVKDETMNILTNNSLEK